MNYRRQIFLNHVAQTSDAPKIIDVATSQGIYIIDTEGRKYFDLASGIGPSILGHQNEAVNKAINLQAAQHLHTMVYGEHIQSPQIKLAKLLVEHLPKSLTSVYFLSAGTEAVEGAIKLGRIATKRTKILSASNAYHGSTLGAESLRSDINFTQHLAPLIPGIGHLRFGNLDDLQKIDQSIACVIMETVQAEAGLRIPSSDYMVRLRHRCTEVGALLILDEIQMGLGRTGRLWAFEHYGVVPDILILGKALGGGLPLSAFISSQEIMNHLSTNPMLAHLSTFGGNPLCCAAGLATVQQIITGQLWHDAENKGKFFENIIKHDQITEVRRLGLMIAMDFKDAETAFLVCQKWLEVGIISDLLLFSHQTVRIAPPLTINESEMEEAWKLMQSVLDEL